MPNIIEISNPFEPLKDSKVSNFETGKTLKDWLSTQGKTDFEKATVVILNDKPLMRADWETRKFEEGDIVNVVTLPAGLDPVTWLYIVLVVMVVASVAVALLTKVPDATKQTQGDSVFTLKGQKNQVRLGDPIEVSYGRCRLYPSYAAAPYNKYENNNQFLYLLLCFGQGKFQIESLQIEDTPIENFSEVTYEIVEPGQSVTLFPDNVVTSSEVSNTELLGTNEGTGGEWIVDSEGDEELGIPESGHYTARASGPFVVNDPNTLCSSIDFDVSLPRGLYRSKDNGSLGTLTVTALFEAQKIDNAGAPLGEWFTASTFSKVLATNTPQRYTLSATVEPGRYRVRGSRTNAKDTDSRAGNELRWESVRAFLPSVNTYPGKTVWAIKAKATNNLSDNSSNRFNAWAVRKLSTWNNTLQAWTEETPTRSLIWAFCDIFRASYGGRLANKYLNLAELASRDAQFTALGLTFDHVFDQRTTCWDAAKLAANIARAVPMLNGSQVSIVRDEAKTVPTSVFSSENTITGSFHYDLKLAALDEYDGLLVSYLDPETWKEETVLCLMMDSEGVAIEAGDYPEKITLYGCTDRTQAYRWGMWKRSCDRLRRQQAVFRTGLEGHIPTYGDLILVQNDVTRWGQSGQLLNIGSDGKTLLLSERVTFETGKTYKMYFRGKTGIASALYSVTAGENSNQVILGTAIDPDDFPINLHREKPIYLFGETGKVSKACLVFGVAPSDSEEIEITAVPYRDEPYSFDEYVPADKGNTSGNVPSKPALPTVTGLLVVRATGTVSDVMASWNPVSGASYYIPQFSYDGVSWEDLPSTDATSIRFSVRAEYLYVRVKGVTTGGGAWAYWTGQAPVEKTNIVLDDGVIPGALPTFTATSGVESIVLQWTLPTNTKLKAVNIYESSNTTKPETPLASVPVGPSATTGVYFRHNLPTDSTRYYWAEAEGLNGRVGTASGPVTGTVVLWPRISDIEQSLSAKISNGETAPENPSVGSVWYKSTEGNKPYIWTGSAWVGIQDSLLTTLNSTVTNSETGLAATRAEVLSGEHTWADADTALAGSISSLSATVGTNSTNITETATALATLNGEVAGEYVFKIVTNADGTRRAVGFRITNTGGATGSTDFIIQADKFVVTNSAGENLEAPYAVIDGITYINTAMIKNASIVSAMIDSLVADKIAAGTITAQVAIASPKLSASGLLYNTTYASAGKEFLPVIYGTVFSTSDFTWPAATDWSDWTSLTEIPPMLLYCPGHASYGTAGSIKVCPDYTGNIKALFNASLGGITGIYAIGIYYRINGGTPVALTSNTDQFSNGNLKENSFRTIPAALTDKVEIFLGPMNPAGGLALETTGSYALEATFFNW